MSRAPRSLALVAGILFGAGAAAAFVFLMRPAPSPPLAVAAKPRAAAAPPPAVAVDTGPVPRVETVDCWFPIPQGREARCGSLVVAENPARPRGRHLHLRFVVFAGTRPDHASDPAIYISGGPGEPAEIDAASIGRWWAWIGRARWLSERDLVVFDQRGVGVSEPQMNCPEIAEAGYRIFPQPLPHEEEARRWADAARRCHDRLAAAGLDLTQYNTRAISDDLAALIAGLGYRRWRLFAVSYGTRVALEFLRDHPGSTESVVLDSVYPPEARSYIDGPRNAARAFAALFAECAGDEACNAAYPHLAQSFEALVRRTAAQPLSLTVTDPRRHAPVTVEMGPGRLIETLFYGFYEWRSLQRMPATIAGLALSDAALFRPLADTAFASYASDKASHGLYLSVECHDEYPFNPPAAVESAAAAVPLFKEFALDTLPLFACPGWPVGSAAAGEREAVASDLPILILAGELDPATSPAWAKEAIRHLPHAHLIRFPGVGHGVVAAHACADRLIARFFDAPTAPPFDECLLALGKPDFVHAAAARD